MASSVSLLCNRITLQFLFRIVPLHQFALLIIPSLVSFSRVNRFDRFRIENFCGPVIGDGIRDYSTKPGHGISNPIQLQAEQFHIFNCSVV